MPKTIILQKDSPILREVAMVVPESEISSAKIKSVISKMKSAVHAEDDGVAIAAPQIGVGLRIFVVEGRTLNIGKNADKEIEFPDLVFINPEITKL